MTDGSDEKTNPVCPHCGGQYNRISGHWQLSSDCSHPEIPDDLLEFWKGCFEGHGNLKNPSQDRPNGRLAFQLADKSKVEALRVASGVFGAKTVSEREHNSKTVDGYTHSKSVFYEWRTTPHPQISEQELDIAQEPTPWSAAGLIHIIGYKRDDRDTYEIDTTEKCAKTISEDFSKFDPRVSEHGSSTRVTFYSDFLGFAETGIPSGWWNDKYHAPHVPRPAEFGGGDADD